MSRFGEKLPQIAKKMHSFLPILGKFGRFSVKNDFF